MPLLRHHLGRFSAKLSAINSSRIPPPAQTTIWCKKRASAWCSMNGMSGIKVRLRRTFSARPLGYPIPRASPAILNLGFAAENEIGSPLRPTPLRPYALTPLRPYALTPLRPSPAARDASPEDAVLGRTAFLGAYQIDIPSCKQPRRWSLRNQQIDNIFVSLRHHRVC